MHIIPCEVPLHISFSMFSHTGLWFYKIKTELKAELALQTGCLTPFILDLVVLRHHTITTRSNRGALTMPCSLQHMSLHPDLQWIGGNCSRRMKQQIAKQITPLNEQTLRGPSRVCDSIHTCPRTRTKPVRQYSQRESCTIYGRRRRGILFVSYLRSQRLLHLSYL